MSLFFRKKPAEVDPLHKAANAQSHALAVFERAKNELTQANEHYETVKATEQARIADAQARHDQATVGQAQVGRVVAKLNDLLGT